MGNLFSGSSSAAAAPSPLASGLSPPVTNKKTLNGVAPTPAASPTLMNRMKGAVPSFLKKAPAPAAAVAAAPAVLKGGRRASRQQRRGSRKQRQTSRRQTRK